VSLGCPECGAEAPPDAKPGVVYACDACGNPVLPGEPVVASLAVDEYVPRATRSPWTIVAIALAVLAAAHAGLWALLTAESRRERESLLRVDGDALLAATDPGAAPSTDDPAHRPWIAADRLWTHRLRYESLGSHVSQLAIGLGVSFTAQAVVLSLLGVRWLRSRRGSPPPPRAPGSRASRGP
jgi:hypothetical protein